MTRPVEVLIHHMRSTASSHDEWAAIFARSILKQAKRRNWQPSKKQLGVMDRLVAEMFNETDEMEVLEEI